MPKPLKVNPPRPPTMIFPVVGIGASAGGLDAYKRLLKEIPENSGMAYILLQHLDPTHESMLPEILSKTTRIPVHEITDNIQIAPDHIYIIPSNKLIIAQNGVLKLKPRPSKVHKTNSIDSFFASLAAVYKEHAAGVILSGTGNDGTAGLQSIREQGGITIVQEPESAAYDGMPRSAIDAKVADFILPPEKIPQQLHEINFLSKSGDEQGNNAYEYEDSLRKILNLLHIRRSVDFTYYKKNTINRRLTRRMTIGNINKLSDYFTFLQSDAAELDALFEDLLIPVSLYFRDVKPFHELKEKVFPAIIKTKTNKDSLRIWVPGCSTGEEVYSIAISIYEFLDKNSSQFKIQIFGTDISQKAISTARAGLYSAKQLEVLSEDRLKDFFIKLNGQYQVAKYIRDMCVFANHNFLRDPPFAKLDLISCRNSLIYMESFLQKKALTTFHYALKEKGFLMLGKSETTGSSSDLYSVVNKHEKIYSKINLPGSNIRKNPDRSLKISKEDAPVSGKAELLQPDFQSAMDAVLLQEFTPAGVVINDHSDIVHFRGDTSFYLSPSPGKASLNLIKMARQGLAFELRNAIHKAKSSNKSISKDGIPIEYSGETKQVSINVIRLPKTIEPYFLVLFKETTVPNVTEQSLNQTKNNHKADSKDRRIAQLETELAQSREDNRAITEDQEGVNEELQSANEELLSGSEELQSLNEELETSKEELQSSNEELIIVNQELLERNSQISDGRKYSDAIIATIREPLIVLNQSMVISTANEAFYKTFHVTEKDTEGKLLYEIGNHQWDIPKLRSILQKVISQRTKVLDFEVAHKFTGLGKRVMLLNVSLIKRDTDQEQLILLAIDDITEKKNAEKKLQLLNQELEKKVALRTNDLKKINQQFKQSNDDLLQFAHVASHDLKEPLRKIKTFANRLEDDEETTFSDKSKVFLSKIKNASERMMDMVDGVLNYSQMGSSEKSIEVVDLMEIFKNIEADVELLMQQKNATLNYPSLPRIEGASILIYQLFYNLINNSLKFSKADSKQEIHIKYKIVKSGTNQHINISIKDKGIGFKPEAAEKIFESFTRLNSKDKFEGTGLGLTLCKKIVEIHGGRITAKGVPNKGAEFTITLPMKQPNNLI